MSMLCSPYARPEEDPVALVESCYTAILWILRSHEGRQLRRTWIDQPYGEEELTRWLTDTSQPRDSRDSQLRSVTVG